MPGARCSARNLQGHAHVQDKCNTHPPARPSSTPARSRGSTCQASSALRVSEQALGAVVYQAARRPLPSAQHSHACRCQMHPRRLALRQLPPLLFWHCDGIRPCPSFPGAAALVAWAAAIPSCVIDCTSPRPWHIIWSVLHVHASGTSTSTANTQCPMASIAPSLRAMSNRPPETSESLPAVGKRAFSPVVG